jgi:hypothetical protein
MQEYNKALELIDEAIKNARYNRNLCSALEYTAMALHGSECIEKYEHQEMWFFYQGGLDCLIRLQVKIEYLIEQEEKELIESARKRGEIIEA